MKGTIFMFGEFCLIYKACEIASEFEIEVSRPCVVGRQRIRANYPVKYPSDYWRISICLVSLDHLVEEISERVVSNGGGGRVLSKPCISPNLSRFGYDY